MGVDALRGSMRSIHFNVQGLSRSYWDIFVAAGFTISMFYFFYAILAWAARFASRRGLGRMRGIAWLFALAFAVGTVVSCLYLFVPPIVFGILITMPGFSVLAFHQVGANSLRLSALLW